MFKLWPKFIFNILLALLVALPISTPAYGKVYEFTEGNRLTLLQDARAAVELKLEMVRNAKHHVHIITYYWDDKGYPMELVHELKKAHARGVHVRIVTSYLANLLMDFFGKSSRELKSGKKDSSAVLTLMGLLPGNNQSITNNIHEKIFLVDGKSAILGGRNISDNDYRAKDMEVLLEGAVVNQVQSHFSKMLSFLIDVKTKDVCMFQNSLCLKKYNKPKFKNNDLNYYPEQPHYKDGSRARILTNEVLFDQYLNNYSGDARFKLKDDIIDTIVKINFTRMRAYNYFILPVDRYKDFLIKNLEEGKQIDIITNSNASASHISNKGYLYGLPEMRNLVEKGLNLHWWLGTKRDGGDLLEYLHEKVMLFDDDHGIIGSHNFGTGSTSVSSEIAIEFFSKPIVQTLGEVFEEETNSDGLTQDATLPLIEDEIENNKKMIAFLRLKLIRNFIRELY